MYIISQPEENIKKNFEFSTVSKYSSNYT